MQKPVQVTFRHLPVSDTVEAACFAEAQKLERYYDRITSCHVVISVPHQHHQKGNLHEVRVHLAVPGGTLDVTRSPPRQQEDEDVFVAIRDAFDTTRRRLEDHVRKLRGNVKTHGGSEKPAAEPREDGD